MLKDFNTERLIYCETQTDRFMGLNAERVITWQVDSLIGRQADELQD